MNEALRNELLALAAEDRRVRAELAAGGGGQAGEGRGRGERREAAAGLARAEEASGGVGEVSGMEERMSEVKLNLLVMKTHQLDRLPDFYAALGIAFTEEKHDEGPLHLAGLHFVAALPNTHYFEYCIEQGALRQTLTKQRFPVVNGEISVPEEPGLGIELDEAVANRFRVA